MRPIKGVLLLVIAKFARRLVEVAISLSRRSATRSLTVFSALSHNNVKYKRNFVAKPRFFYLHAFSCRLSAFNFISQSGDVGGNFFRYVCLYCSADVGREHFNILEEYCIHYGKDRFQERKT